MSVVTYIGIGSNLGDPLAQVTSVIPLLGEVRDTELLAHSAYYQSEPISDIPQEDYVNAVACLRTKLNPTELLLELQAIEYAFYRQREDAKKWAPRTMDLDIILYGQTELDDTHLTIPHPEMHNRLFVLQPLLEIAGDIYIPKLGSVQHLIKQAPDIRLQRIPALT